MQSKTGAAATAPSNPTDDVSMPRTTRNVYTLELGTAVILQSLEVLLEPGQVAELRILNAGKDHTVSGYFSDPAALAEAAARWDGRAPGVYITLNPVNPALLARANNRVVTRAATTTADADIQRRRWLPLDFDPRRPAGISSSDIEKRAAYALAQTVRDWLRGLGWPEPVVGDSGNGYHLLYAIDLPNTPEATELVRQCLQVLDMVHSTDAVGIDTSTFNAARIWKLYGTLAAKGDNTPDRPHRRANILQVPDQVELVPLDKLQALAAMLPEAPKPEAHPAGRSGKRLDVPEYCQKHGLTISKTKPWQGGTLYELETCPWNPDHHRTARIVQFSNGALSAACFHNACQGRGWHDLRDVVEPGWRDRQKVRPLRIVQPPQPGTESEPVNLTDLGNARRLVKQFGQDLRYCYPFGCWYVWDGRRWIEDTTATVERLAKETVRMMYLEAAGLDDAERKALVKHALRSEAKERLAAMLLLARSEEGIPVLPEELDRDPYLLNVANGTLDLRTGQLRPHRREDMITRIINVNYDPKAQCPLWESFLKRIMGGNQHLIDFLQRAAGYSLTGDVSEQVLFLAHGTGANGKTVFLRTLLNLLGPYGKPTEPELLLARHGEVHPTGLADLMGARLAVVLETEEGRRLNESLTKWLTGGDKLKARKMRQDFFEFEPTHKIWLATNHKPTIRGTDYAIWRRLRLIPFNITIPEEERDPHLVDKLKAELPGILAWAVRGCLAWQERGLGMPDEVKQATEAYREEMDLLADFLAECCITGTDKRASAKQLYEAYCSWCGRNGEHILTQKAFGMRLSERGLERKKTGGVYWWRGIGLVNGGDDGDDQDLTSRSYIGKNVAAALNRKNGPDGLHGLHGLLNEAAEVAPTAGDEESPF